MEHASLDPDQSQYASREWIASVLGKSLSWVDKNMPRLIDNGFPKPDPLIGKTYKPDVFEWMERRRKFKSRDRMGDAIIQKRGENLDKF